MPPAEVTLVPGYFGGNPAMLMPSLAKRLLEARLLGRPQDPKVEAKPRKATRRGTRAK